MPINERVICSTITLRNRPLSEALEIIDGLGFGGIDLGALPGVCDHVPMDLSTQSVASVADQVATSGLSVASVNGDIGDLNIAPTPELLQVRRDHLSKLFQLCREVGSPALVLPCGALSHEPINTLESDLDLVAEGLRAAAAQGQAEGIEVWVEAQHSMRLCYNTERAARLMDRLADDPVGLVMDFSHIIASEDTLGDFVVRLGNKISHVHLRDAKPGEIHLAIGTGDVDFDAGIRLLLDRGYSGLFSLELETRDVAEAERPAAAKKAGEQISAILDQIKK